MKDTVDVLDEVLRIDIHDRVVEVEEGEAPRIGAVVVPGLVEKFATFRAR